MFTPQRKGWSLSPRSAERNGLLLSNPRSAGGTRFEKGKSIVRGAAPPQNLLGENGVDARGSGAEVEVWKRFRESGMIDEAALEKAGEALLERIDKLENEVSKEKDAVPMIPSGKKSESREEMLSRHRHDISELQNKEMSLKKAAAKGSKAEQKAKKKQVEDEISRLSSELKDRHTKELASMGYSNNKEKGDLDNLVMAIAGVSVSSDVSKPRKSAKKREKRAQQEAQREQRIQQEQGSIISDRMIEDEKLEKKLKPLGLMIKEIKPDGHCLYRAVEDQLSLHLRNSSTYSYQELRQMAARYMREHASEFLPFFLSDTEIDTDDSMERFEKYCKEVESTAAWGGQLELGALTHCLHKHIVIFSGSFPDVEMGKEYKSESGSISSNPSVMLSYHRHAYGLGEHYNSVVPSSE